MNRPAPVTLAIAGAGERGRNVYGRWCRRNPTDARVVAVADPDSDRCAALAAEHDLADAARFAGWRELLARPRLADAIVIATPDREHAAAAIAALERGYDVILEKPIAPTEAEVEAVAAAAAGSRGSVTVAHVLRYTPFFSLLKQLLDEGRIGELVTVTHAESIGYWHFAHSFVRGNWRSEASSSPMILAKACHDLDLLRWLAGDRCTAVASFGGLHHFRAEQAPPGALDRCWDGVRRCPAAPDCPFDAHRFYVDRLDGVVDWPITVIGAGPDRESRLDAIAAGPYGRCVYHADNDVADHQVTALEFANGVRATLTVSGLTAENTRSVTLAGTRGELRGRLDTGEIEVRRFLPGHAAPPPGPWDRDELGRAGLRGDERELLVASPTPIRDGHGGGDDAMLRDVLDRLRARRDRGSRAGVEAMTSLTASIESHLMAFAAERSRRERRVVELPAR